MKVGHEAVQGGGREIFKEWDANANFPNHYHLGWDPNNRKKISYGG